MNKTTRWLLALMMGAATVWTFLVPDAVGFQNPRLARIIFFHLPPAFISTAFFFAGAWYSFKFLKTRESLQDLKAVGAVELSLLFAAMTMISGIIFSKVQWGDYWHWDPRQTSFLMVLLMYSSYFLLRAAFPDREKRATNSAGYALAAVIPAIFLIFVFPRLPMVQSLHPSNTVVDTFKGSGGTDDPTVVEVVEGDISEAATKQGRRVSSSGGGLDAQHTMVLLTIGGLLLSFGIWSFRLRVRAGLLELEAEESVEGLDDRGDTAATGVVRPVSVSTEDRGAD